MPPGAVPASKLPTGPDGAGPESRIMAMLIGILGGAVNGSSTAAEDPDEVRATGCVVVGGVAAGGGGIAIRNAIACRGNASG